MKHDPPSPASADPLPDGDRRRYDSYTVRIWHRPGQVSYDRAEVHHLQTGSVTAATRVTSGWIQAVIDRETDVTATGGSEPE